MAKPIHSKDAPQAIGPYSQAIQINQTVYLSGQIALLPQTGELITGGIEAQTTQVFHNIQAVAQACDCTLAQVVKMTIYMIDLADFKLVNGLMEQFFDKPYPARSTVAVAALPRNALIEVDAILHVD